MIFNVRPPVFEIDSELKLNPQNMLCQFVVNENMY